MELAMCRMAITAAAREEVTADKLWRSAPGWGFGVPNKIFAFFGGPLGACLKARARGRQAQHEYCANVLILLYEQMREPLPVELVEREPASDAYYLHVLPTPAPGTLTGLPQRFGRLLDAIDEAARLDQVDTDADIAEAIANLEPDEHRISFEPTTRRTDQAALRFADEAALYLTREFRVLTDACSRS